MLRRTIADPLRDRVLRTMLASILPHRHRFRLALSLAALAQPLAGWFERRRTLRPLATLLRLRQAASAMRSAQRRSAAQPGDAERAQRQHAAPTRPAAGALRVGLAYGCVEPVLDPEIQEAGVRLLRRAGCEIVRAKREGCCGALSHHMGREEEALSMARANVDAWHRELKAGPLAAIVVTASGCGPVIRDYGHLLRNDPEYADKAAQISGLACDLSELLDRIGLPPMLSRVPPTIVAYHPACSLQHGQRVVAAPARLLTQAGFEVRVPQDAHLCCGSAGVYNILQPEIAAQLGARKAQALAALGADVIVTGNIGCMVQLSGTSVPVVHLAQLLDWATGGPKPDRMG